MQLDVQAPVMYSTNRETNTKVARTNAPMDRVRKLLSPGAKKRIIQTPKVFGIPLEDLLKGSSEECEVPMIVKKICEYVHNNGCDQEGIFRVNGNARAVEKLRASFDQAGDANLDECKDIMAVASTLKLFLREIPDGVIPENMTHQFVSVQREYSHNKIGCLAQLKQLLETVPNENHQLLKYLMKFAIVISQNEAVNKMSPMALSIVFGPNIFRCGPGIAGLKDQGATNQIVYKFLTEYDTLFRGANEQSPSSSEFIPKKKVAPPRPPPPKIQAKEPLTPSHDQYEWDQSDSSCQTPRSRGSGACYSPRFSDEDTDRTCSPFVLDNSEVGHSIAESPVISATALGLVNNIIRQAVSEHALGEGDQTLGGASEEFSQDSIEVDAAASPLVSSPATPDDVKDSLDDAVAPVRDRIRQFQDLDMEADGNSAVQRPRKQRPLSAAFDLFENKGVIIGQVSDKGAKSIISMPDKNSEDFDNSTNAQTISHPVPKPRISKTSNSESYSNNNGEEFVDCIESGFGSIQKTPGVLIMNFKRPAGPANRRSPSRKSRLSQQDDLDIEINGVLDDSNHSAIPDRKPFSQLQQNYVSPTSSSDDDVHHGPIKTQQFKFLDKHHNGHEDRTPPMVSPDRSPGNHRKPFVPPLDLSTLHEHGDGSDPILADKGQSVSYHLAKKSTALPNDDVIISPRSSKMKRKTDSIWDFEAPPSPSAFNVSINFSVSSNTDIAPYPPMEQNQYHNHSSGPIDDELSVKLKQVTKKIQLYKKKIKQFEDSFEKENGYKPSQADKAARHEVKKYMSELTKARREIRKLKDEAEMESRSRHGSGASSGGGSPPVLPSSMEQTFLIILHRLREKRQESERPEDIDLMSQEQIHEEKLAVQKGLLHFENLHGRPKTKDEKDLMRPLYDRYRIIKRLLAKPISPKDKADLQTVPEDQPFELASTSPQHVIQVPIAEAEDTEEENAFGTTEFAVTQDFGILRETVRPITMENLGSHSPKSKRQLFNSSEEQQNAPGSNLHELSFLELQEEFNRSQSAKKRLRNLLREFEDDFFQSNGRKVQKEDRKPLQNEYQEYKQVKARLRLCEALLSKYNLSHC